MTRYYEAYVKCGHVKRSRYIIKAIYLKARDGKDAAISARKFPRVKHHHKDAVR